MSSEEDCEKYHKDDWWVKKDNSGQYYCHLCNHYVGQVKYP